MDIIDEARNSIGHYCMGPCKALCCRKGKLHLADQQEVDAVTGKRGAALEKQGMLIRRSNGESDLDIEKGCTSLTKDFTCAIYTHLKRPAVCHNFPIFVHGEQIIIADWCPAVKAGLLDEYKKKFIEQGFLLRD